jgi:hypothetical protein
MKVLLSKNTEIDVEQMFILKEICAFLILKNYIEELQNKNKNIDYFQSKLDKDSISNDFWNSLKHKNIFVEETNE